LIDRGIRIDSNDEQSESAFASIRVSFDPDSKVNDESDVHEENEDSPINTTEAGRQTDANDEQPSSAFASIRGSFDPDSKVNEQSESHQEKQ
jgi:hypothetical protein